MPDQPGNSHTSLNTVGQGLDELNPLLYIKLKLGGGKKKITIQNNLYRK
jgi:hypothetical protein